MKTICFILLLLLGREGLCQTPELRRTWVNEKNETLLIADSSLFTDLWYEGLIERDYRRSNDTLYWIEYQWADSKQFPSETPYKILQLTADSLMLVYDKKYLGLLTGEKDTLTFVDSVKIQSYIPYFDTFLFQETHLSSLNVRKKLQIHRSGEVLFWDDLREPAFYQMTLPKVELDSLLKLIHSSRVENFYASGPFPAMHASTYFFTLASEKDILRTTMQKVPYFNWPLFEYLHSIMQTVVKDENRAKSLLFIE
jgi:hypothetical protein